MPLSNCLSPFLSIIHSHTHYLLGEENAVENTIVRTRQIIYPHRMGNSFPLHLSKTGIHCRSLIVYTLLPFQIVCSLFLRQGILLDSTVPGVARHHDNTALGVAQHYDSAVPGVAHHHTLRR